MVREKVESVLSKIRSSLQAAGGDVELVDPTPEGALKVRLAGASSGCPLNQMSLTMGIEKMIKQKVPEMKEVADGDLVACRQLSDLPAF